MKKHPSSIRYFFISFILTLLFFSVIFGMIIVESTSKNRISNTTIIAMSSKVEKVTTVTVLDYSIDINTLNITKMNVKIADFLSKSFGPAGELIRLAAIFP